MLWMNFCEILGGVISWDGKQLIRFWICMSMACRGRTLSSFHHLFITPYTVAT